MKIMTGKISCLLSILFFTALVAALAMVLYGFWAPLAATIQDTPVQLPVQPGPILEAILLFALLLILAVGLLLFALFAKRGQFIESRARFIHLAFFMLLAGIWLFFESQVPFLISSTRIAFRFSAYFSFYLMAVPFLLFIRDMCEHGETILNGLIVLFLLNFAFHFGYLWRHDFLFPESLIFVHSLMAISLLILILISGMEVFHYQNSEARGLLLALVFLGLFSAAGLLQYYLDPMADGVMMWTIGVVVFVLVLALDTMGRVFANYSKIKQFQTIADSIPNGLFRAKNDRHLTLIYANDAFFSTYGYRSAQEAEKAGFLWVDFAIDSQQQDKLWQLRQQYLAQGTYCFEIEARTHDVQGKVIWVLNRLEYQPDSDEICGAMMEITDRKNMETLLRIRAEQYRIAVAQSGKRIFRYDIKTKTLYHQHANAEMLSAESAVKNIPDIAVTRGIIAPESVDAYLHFYQMIQQGDKTGQAVVRMRDEEKSQYLWYHCDFTTIFDDGEQPQQSIIS
ncbi:MAG: PAS domain-containing protein, partial [Clostridiales bacterium]